MLNYQLHIFRIAMITLLAGCASTPHTRSQAPALPTAQLASSPSGVVVALPSASPASAPSAAVAARDERRPTPAQPSAAMRAASDRALADLAQALGIAQSAIELLGVQPRYGTPPNSDSAGPPAGWNIRLGVGADVYLYQVDARGVLKRVPAQR